MTLTRRLVAEGLGTALLLVAVVGSGIMAERLSGGNAALALLANSLATGGALVALIVTFAPISGAHFNPAVTVALAARGELQWTAAAAYIAVQFAAGILGVLAAHAMFGLPLLEWSQKARPGLGQMWAEFLATFGLLAIVLSCVAVRSRAVPYAVAAYITGAYWFTSSTSFANPAVTVARTFTNTFAGIGQGDVPGFILAQAGATLVAVPLFAWLFRGRSESS
ncbi:MAG TPA: MIP/aquaporin family protein [Burkholderiales bacterium]